MATTLYDDAPLDVRADIRAAHAQRLDEIASPGTWFDAKTRVAIAAEARNANGCKLCSRRTAALSPLAVDGMHDSLDDLPEPVIEVIHRIATDPSRLSQRWYRNCLERADGRGICRDCGRHLLDDLTRYVCARSRNRAIATSRAKGRRTGARAPSRGETGRRLGVVGCAPGRWERWGDQFGPAASNIRRALSLVPDEARAWFDVVDTQYLNAEQMRDFDTMHRAIDRAQIELVAGRISFLNQCAY